MPSPIEPFIVHYEYDKYSTSMDARRYAESVHGYSRIYSVAASLLATSRLPGNRGRSAVSTRISSQTANSIELQWILDASVTAYTAFPGRPQDFAVLFKFLSAYLLLPRRTSADRQIDRVYEDRKDERRLIREFRQSEERLLTRAYDLVERSRERAVDVIGYGCSGITQFHRTDDAMTTTESDAAIIRSVDEVIDNPSRYHVLEIEGLNRRTGRCKLRLADNPNRVIKGKIHDNLLRQTPNPYAAAFANRAEVIVGGMRTRKGRSEVLDIFTIFTIHHHPPRA
ncbi:MAG: hypothetical protein F4Y45_18545 [Acidobacteria bacterium]|nr:hypothetical protein [Acidobacteriota bacterium]MYJ03000.1 hypothetical protein [Acidobacteriota bacterium]